MSKVPKIAVCDWDNPEILAKEFCRIYALDDNACAVLHQVITANMRQNGIPIFGDDTKDVVDSGIQQASVPAGGRGKEYVAATESQNAEGDSTARDNQDGQNAAETVELAPQASSRSMSEHDSSEHVQATSDEELLPHYDVMNWLLEGAAAARRRTVEEAQHQYMAGK